MNSLSFNWESGATDARGEHKPLRLLFVSHVASQLRHFVGLFETLAARGHDITIMFEHRSLKPQSVPAFLAHIPGLSVVPILMAEGPWGPYTRAIRGSRNYLLYYEEDFKNATVFRDRSHGWVDPHLKDKLRKDRPPSAETINWLEGIERAVPPSSNIQDFLKDGRFDIVLVSPYIFYQNTSQLDYVKACHKLAIPVGFPVFSWDNLTTKGNIQIEPDRIWVWNDVQRQELIKFHKVDHAKIGVMGAWRFDHFSTMSPSLERVAFCSRYGLDPEKPLIAYLGSSPAIAPKEGVFVARWLSALRAHPDPILATANVLIRSHPRNVEAWKGSGDIASHPHVSFQEPESRNLFETQGLFDLLVHSHAAIGLNTSAMLEAAILRRPVLTVKDQDFAHGHDGTVHFDYLTSAGGGLLYVAKDFTEHFALLAPILKRSLQEPDKRAAAFSAAFIDAGASPVAATCALANEVEKLASMKKVPVAQSLADRVRYHILTLRLRTRHLRLQRDPDYVSQRGLRMLRWRDRLLRLADRTVGRLENGDAVKCYLLTATSRSFGFSRCGPIDFGVLPLYQRVGLYAFNWVLRMFVRLSKPFGFYGFLRETLGRPASLYRLELAGRVTEKTNPSPKKGVGRV